MTRATVSILMPVFNERQTVEAAIGDALAADVGAEVQLIVVDDGSTDGTSDVLERIAPQDERITLLRHDHNSGKGRALQTALRAATGSYATVLDADLEYEAANIRPLLEPLLSGEAEAVFGVRGFQSHSAYNFWYVLGNKGVTLAANLIYNSWVSDIMTCHKAMPTELFRSLRLRERGFGIEPEITARLLRRGVRIYEVPVTYKARSRESGKKLTATDGVRVLLTLLRCRID